ncbi:hypothetical protein QEN19_000490 [Hanseniaspora menglaensis]
MDPIIKNSASKSFLYTKKKIKNNDSEQGTIEETFTLRDSVGDNIEYHKKKVIKKNQECGIGLDNTKKELIENSLLQQPGINTSSKEIDNNLYNVYSDSSSDEEEKEKRASYIDFAKQSRFEDSDDEYGGISNTNDSIKQYAASSAEEQSDDYNNKEDTYGYNNVSDSENENTDSESSQSESYNSSEPDLD